MAARARSAIASLFGGAHDGNALTEQQINETVDRIKVALQNSAKVLVEVEWRMHDSHEPWCTWHGTVFVDNGTLFVDYEDAEGWDESCWPLPATNVDYKKIEHRSLPKGARSQEREEEEPEMEFQLHDPSTYVLLGDPKQREIAKLSLRNRIDLVKLTPKDFELLDLMLDAAAEQDQVDGKFADLCEAIFRHARDKAAELQGLNMQLLSSKLAKNDFAGDPYMVARTETLAEAEKKHAVQTEKRKKRFCNFCKRRGHSEQYCWQKNRSGGEPAAEDKDLPTKVNRPQRK